MFERIGDMRENAVWKKAAGLLISLTLASVIAVADEHDRWYSQAALEKCLDIGSSGEGDRQYATRCLSLPVVVQGGAWSTEIEIRNRYAIVEAAYELLIRSDDPRGLYVQGVGLNGWVRKIEGRIPPLGTHSYRMDRYHSTSEIEAEILVVRSKSADLLDENGDFDWRKDPRRHSSSRAIITHHASGKPPFQQSLYQRSFIPNYIDSFAIPYRNDGPYMSAIVYASLLGRDEETVFSAFPTAWPRYWVEAYDERGESLCGQYFLAPRPSIGVHEKSFLLEDFLPCTEGHRGQIIFRHVDSYRSRYGFYSPRVLVYHEEGPFFEY